MAIWGRSGQGTEPPQITQVPCAWTILGAHRPSPVVLPLSPMLPQASPIHSWFSVYPNATTHPQGQSQHVNEPEHNPMRGEAPWPPVFMNAISRDTWSTKEGLRPWGVQKTLFSRGSNKYLSLQGLWDYKIIFGEQDRALVATDIN